MSRRAQEITSEPFRSWFVTVDQYNRIRLPQEIASVVRWIDLQSEQIECAGAPGPHGGIQLIPLAQHQDQVRQFADALANNPPTASESDQSWVDLARLLATTWVFRMNIEAGRISMTLPEPARLAQQIPQAGSTVVVFGFGEILEVWDALKWNDRVRDTAARKTTAFSQALEDLGQR